MPLKLIELECPGCSERLELDAGFAGGVCRCQHCGTIQTVPSRRRDTGLSSGAVAQAALQQCPHLIVVDDGSSDDTADKLAGLPLTLIRHARCLGKGEALRSGFKAALALGVAGVVTVDGDGQHGADDIPLLLTAAAAHPGQIIIGARLIGRDDQPRGRRRAGRVGAGCQHQRFRAADDCRRSDRHLEL